MRRLLLLAPILFAGCAGPSAEEAMRIVANSSDFSLCEDQVIAPARYQGIIAAEVNRRGVSCGQYMQAIAIRQQAKANQLANENAATANFLRAINPPPAPFPRQTNCTSYRVGNTVQTDCR